MRQPGSDRVLYYRQLRSTIRGLLAPELTSAQARDAAALIDRILAEFIVEEESAPALSEKFGAAFEEALGRTSDSVVSPERFHALRADAARHAEDDDRLFEVERRFLEEVDRLRAEVLADDRSDPPADLACSTTCDELTEVLRRVTGTGVVVDAITVVPGGRSKETLIVSLGGTTELPAEVVVRKDRPVGLLPTRAADEYTVIKEVHDFGGIPVPEPYVAGADGDLTFLVMERVPGHKAGEYFPDLAAPTEHRAAIGTQIAAALARLHAMPAADAEVTEESIVTSVEAMVSRVGEITGPPCAAVPVARRWLLDHVSDVVPASRTCRLQGDFGFHNMLIDGDRLTALVDWEAATLGPPARELAAAWGAATALMPWADFVTAYVAAGGQPEDAEPRAVGYYRVLGALGGFLTSRTGGHLFRTGTKRDLLTAHSGLDSHFRCARNLARALGDVR